MNDSEIDDFMINKYELSLGIHDLIDKYQMDLRIHVFRNSYF